MALYRSSMNMGAELCLPWRCGRGRWGKPRIERISRCISRRSWLRRRRWMKLECTSLSRLKSARAERSRSRGAQSATKLRGAAAQGERTCIAPALRATRAPGPRLRAPRRPRWRRGAGGRPRRSVTCCRRAPLRPRQTWPLPGRLRSARTPAPRSALAPGPLAPHSPGRTAGLGNRLEGASGRAGGGRGGGRGWEEQPADPGAAERAPGRRRAAAGGGRASAPSSRSARALPSGGGDPRSSELRRREQGPRAAPPAARALDRTRGRLGSPRLVRARAWEEEAEDGLPGAPPAPAASHLPSAPPSPQLRPMGSFIPSTALYKYLPSAHGVPGARPSAAGMRTGESEPALASRARGRDREGGGQSDPWDSFWG
uniref:Uncharacterized protein n=1 Tax=Canis lupus familiaris TaxID=9615 RepID=A0A8C0SVJ9_CANLF